MLTAREWILNVRPKRLRVLGVVVGLAIAGGASASKYTVRPGDTLALIASRNHTTVAALAQANSLKNPDHIEVGQSLMLSVKPAAPTLPLQLISVIKATPKTTALPDGYLVRPGDTLAGIASRLGRSPVALAAANGIVGDILYTGARLRVDVSAAGAPVVPAAPFIAVPTATVGSATTMAKQAKRLGV